MIGVGSIHIQWHQLLALSFPGRAFVCLVDDTRTLCTLWSIITAVCPSPTIVEENALAFSSIGVVFAERAVFVHFLHRYLALRSLHISGLFEFLQHLHIDGGCRATAADGEGTALLVDDTGEKLGIKPADFEADRAAVAHGVVGSPGTRHIFVDQFAVGADVTVCHQLQVDGVGTFGQHHGPVPIAAILQEIAHTQGIALQFLDEGIHLIDAG